MLTALVRYLLVCGASMVLGGVALAQTNPAAEAWRKKELEAYVNAVPTPALARMSTVDRLLAIEEIRQIPAKYCRCINQRDWDCWTHLFADDADVWNPKLGIVKGPSGMYQQLIATGIASSRVHSQFIVLGGPEIEILSPTTARGVFQEQYTFSSSANEPSDSNELLVAPGQEVRSLGIYYQTYEKKSGTWKIKSNIHLDLRHDRGPLSSETTFVDVAAPTKPK
jgi:hypothetical protein